MPDVGDNNKLKEKEGNKEFAADVDDQCKKQRAHDEPEDEYLKAALGYCGLHEFRSHAAPSMLSRQ